MRTHFHSCSCSALIILLLVVSSPTRGVAAASWAARCTAPGLLPLLDAHSQFDETVRERLIIERMDESGVIGTILSTRGRQDPIAAARFAEREPRRIVVAASTKQQRKYDAVALLSSGRFHSAAEILLYHARKGHRAPEIRAVPDDPALLTLYQTIVGMRRPLVLHIEFRALKGRDRLIYWQALESIVERWPEVPVELIHMAQLGPSEAENLLRRYTNVFFLTSHADPITISQSKQPWTNMFSGHALDPEWRALIERYPNQFVFAIDNVWPENWETDYSIKVALWRKGLADLPGSVARQVGCGNAVRLWQLDGA